LKIIIKTQQNTTERIQAMPEFIYRKVYCNIRHKSPFDDYETRLEFSEDTVGSIIPEGMMDPAIQALLELFQGLLYF
jgi:hypothetical protein